MKFSERVGSAQIKYTPQRESMDKDLRNVIWNVVFSFYFSNIPHGDFWKSKEIHSIALRCQAELFKKPLDDLPDYGYQYQAEIKNYLLSGKWDQVYDYIDWLANWGKGLNEWVAGQRAYDVAALFCESINKNLEQERSVYRFVDRRLVEITSQGEIDEVNQAIDNNGKHASVSKHLQSAVALMSDRKTPDYRNSIKESISAVESAAKILTGDSKTTLAKALNKLEKSDKLHSALKDGFSKLYGWTSDENGIRHAMMKDSNLDLADARYMLVACSAFVNYLISKHQAV